MKKIFEESSNEEHSLAWEVCTELAKERRRWRFAFFTTAGIEALTVIGFLLYLTRI